MAGHIKSHQKKRQEIDNLLLEGINSGKSLEVTPVFCKKKRQRTLSFPRKRKSRHALKELSFPNVFVGNPDTHSIGR